MAQSLSEQAHAGIHGLSAYVPGKPVEELRRELGLASVIKLASNENPLGTSPAALAALADFAGELYRYPDGSGYAVKQKVAARHGVDASGVTLGNGSDEILELVARVFLAPGKNAVVAQHSFAVYPIVARAVGAEVREIPALGTRTAMPRGHDLAAMRAAIDDHTGVVFIANPNNPTGTWVTPKELAAFLASVPAATVVVLDQAYIEYQTEQAVTDVATWLARFPNLVITRTFSKIFGMAALRFGYGLTAPAVADYLNRIRQPFNVNALALHCAAAAIDDCDFIARSTASNTAERTRLQEALSGRGLICQPSQANFITFDVQREARPVYEALLRDGVIVRPLASYDLPSHLRVTVGTAAENTRFLAALDCVLEP
jgi:histidinol-phosphate aminotransferase